MAFFVISSFCVASFRYFVFSRGVISLFRVALFRLFAWRYFVILRGVISWQKDEKAQISHHTHALFMILDFNVPSNKDERMTIVLAGTTRG